MKHPVENKRDAGFALVDLLATIAIIALMAAMAVPAYSQFLANLRLETACRSLVSEIRFGQQAALTQSRIWRITYISDGFRLDAQNFQTGQYEWSRPEVVLPPGISYEAGYAPTGHMNFNQSGGVGADNSALWTIGFRNAYGQRRYVIITPVTGRAKISSTSSP